MDVFSENDNEPVCVAMKGCGFGCDLILLLYFILLGETLGMAHGKQ